MLKVFRKRRYQLIANSRTAKYFKYGAGEILLVVAGILIALQFNTWNEVRKNNIKEQQILRQLKDEYHTNLLQLDQKIKHRKKIIEAASNVLKLIDEAAELENDQLIAQLNILIGNPTFKPIQNNLISSGDILLVKNRDLNQLLVTWPSDVMHVKEIEGIWNNKMWDSIIPLFNELGILRQGFHKWWSDEENIKWILDGGFENPFEEPMTSKALKASEILKSKKLEGLVVVGVSVNYAANLQSEILQTRILEILELLDSEIKQ